MPGTFAKKGCKNRSTLATSLLELRACPAIRADLCREPLSCVSQHLWTRANSEPYLAIALEKLDLTVIN